MRSGSAVISRRLRVIFQVAAIQGILAFSQRTVADIMIPLSKVLMCRSSLFSRVNALEL
jgi:hypothetical protein